MDMTERNLISVIVPVYKIPYDLLDRCIESILFQTYRYFELILVDDGSPDDCGLILDQYKERDSRIIVIHKNNGGASSARNAGIKEAHGTFLTFIDADDYVVRNYLSDLYTGIHDSNTDLAKCSCVHNKNRKRANFTICSEPLQTQLKVVSKNEALDNLYYSRAPFDEMEVTAFWGTIYKASIAKKIKFKPYVIGEDCFFMCEYLQQISNVCYISTKGYYYNDNDNSALHKQYSDAQILSTVYGLEREIETANCENVTGFRARVLNVLLTIYMLLCPSAILSKKTIESAIKKYRFSALTDKDVKLKLRIAMVLSFFGLDCLKRIFLLLANRKNK